MAAMIFRKVRADEVDVAHGVLVSAAAWLGAKGIPWTIEYPKELYLACQEQGLELRLAIRRRAGSRRDAVAGGAR